MFFNIKPVLLALKLPKLYINSVTSLISIELLSITGTVCTIHVHFSQNSLQRHNPWRWNCTLAMSNYKTVCLLQTDKLCTIVFIANSAYGAIKIYFDECLKGLHIFEIDRFDTLQIEIV